VSRSSHRFLALSAPFLFAVFPGALEPQSPPSALCYEGEIGAGTRVRRVIYAAEQSGGSTTSGTLYFYGRPTQLLPMSSAPTSSRAVRAVGRDGVTSLEWSPDSSNVARLAMLRGRDTVATVLRATSPPTGLNWAIGDWTGMVGDGFATRLGIHVEAGPCGLLVGELDSPDQGQNGLPLTGVRVSPDSVRFEAQYLDLRITTARRPGEQREAVMVQRGTTSSIELRRGVRVTEARRSQEPVRPFPYEEREVRYASRAPGIRLAGTLTLPRVPGRHPAILLISGSGAQDRDETVAGHRPFLVLADHFTRHGYAVLRVDDRGAGQSTGNVLTSGLEDLAVDVLAGLDYLRTVPEIDPGRIGLMGHSEGGFVAPLVAAADPAVAFIGLLAGPAAPGRELLLAQRAAIGRAGGGDEGHRRVDSLLLASIFAVLDTRPDDEHLGARVDSAITAWQARLPAALRPIADSILSARTPAQDSASLALWKSRWFKSIYHHDPRPLLGRLRVPVVAVFGELDIQVPPAQSASELERAFAGSRSGLLTLIRLPAVNHMLQPARTGRMEEYATIEQTVAPEVLAALDRWLARVAPVPSRAQ
jgi:pimeloyl-ACP methyl ester carboxylesterase